MLEKFRSLDFRTSRRAIVTPEERQPDEHAERLALVEEMGRTNQYQDGLRPILQERLDALEVEISLSIESHPKMAETHGRKSEIRNIMELFEQQGE
jgi:hypothetical protein